MTDLNNTLASIGETMNPLKLIPALPTAGPNNWDEIGPEDFGPEHDFELNDQGTIWIFDPISTAALQWCYAHLPEDCPRWGKGYVVEHRYIEDIVNGAKRDNLMSRVDYEQAQNENENLQRQGEDTHGGLML